MVVLLRILKYLSRSKQTDVETQSNFDKRTTLVFTKTLTHDSLHLQTSNNTDKSKLVKSMTVSKINSSDKNNIKNSSNYNMMISLANKSIISVYNCQNFNDFTVSFVQFFSIYFDDEEMRSNFNDVVYELLCLSEDIIKKQMIFRAVINALFNFSYFALRENKEKGLKILNWYLKEYISDIVIDFEKITYNDLLPVVSLINSLFKNYSEDTKLMKFLIDFLNTLFLGADSNVLYKVIEPLTEVFSIFTRDKKMQNEETILLFENILSILGEVKSDILKGNLLFLIEFYARSDSENILNSSIFKNKVIKLCSIYYVETEEEAMRFLEILEGLLDKNIGLTSHHPPLISAQFSIISFVLKIISNLCFKTPLLKAAIENSDFKIINKMKLFASEIERNPSEKLKEIKDDKSLSIIKDSLLSNEIENCVSLISAEKEYVDKTVEENIKIEKRRKTLFFNMIGSDNLYKLRVFLCVPLEINYYSEKKVYEKIYMVFNKDLSLLTVYKQKSGQIKTKQKMELNDMEKCIRSSDSTIFRKNGLFSHKPELNKCYRVLHIKNGSQSNKYNSINFEVESENYGNKFMEYINELISYKNNICTEEIL